mgnify:FL=1
MSQSSLSETTLVFSLSANKVLTAQVCKNLGIDEAPKELKRFPSGEIMAKPDVSVRDKDVYVIQSTSTPVNENLMEVLVFLDAVKRSSCRSITCIIPYFGYARQDRKSRPREPITCKLVADLLVTAGADRVVTFDIHALQEQGFFDCQMDSLSAMPLIAHTLVQECKGDFSNLVIVSPDHGGVVRARNVADHMGAPIPIAVIDKRRNDQYQPEAMNVIGDVKGKECYIVDDMIDTAGTAVMAAKALKDNGAKSVKMAATHAVLSDPAHDRLKASVFDELLFTDTIPLPAKFADMDKIKIVSVAPMIAGVIKRIQEGQPISPVYDMYKAC